MGIRPGRTCREPQRSWSRTAKRVAKKAFVRGVPDSKVHMFEMGVKKSDYDTELDLVTEEDCQIRDNALEAARVSANKIFEKEILPENYFFKVLVYPHQCLREHSMLTGAGADRLSDGMRLSFGRPTGRAVKSRRGQHLMKVRTYKKFTDTARDGLVCAGKKMPGFSTIEVRALQTVKATA